MMDMPKHIRIGKTPLISSYFVTLLKQGKASCVHFVGAANFCIWTFKPLDRSYGYGRARFSSPSIKNLTGAEWIKAMSLDPAIKGIVWPISF